MKRIIVFILVSLGVLSQTCVVNSSPRTVGRGKFSVGIEGDYGILPLKLKSNPTYWYKETVYDPSTGVTTITEREGDYFNETFLLYGSTRTSTRSWSDVEDKTNLLFIRISYGIINNLDGYVKLGMGNKRIHFTENEEYSNYRAVNDWHSISSVDKMTFENYPHAFAWAAGFKGKLYENHRGFIIGTDVSYFSLKNELITLDDESIEENSMGFKFYSTSIKKYESSHSQYQASFTIGQKIKKFLPYAGVEYFNIRIERDYISRINVDAYNNNSLLLTQKIEEKISAKLYSESNVNGILGCKYLIGDNTSINLTWKYYGIMSLNIGMNVIF